MVWTHGGEFTYSYNIPADNWNGRTIAQFSTTADTKMRPDQAAGAYFPDFQKFVDYYGPADYADAWITAALEGAATNFSRGNADFSIWSDNYGALDGTLGCANVLGNCHCFSSQRHIISFPL